VYEPLAATVAWRATAELATSALPDAPVRPENWPRRGRRIRWHVPGAQARRAVAAERHRLRTACSSERRTKCR